MKKLMRILAIVLLLSFSVAGWAAGDYGIKSAPDGQKEVLDGSEAIPLDDNGADKYALISAIIALAAVPTAASLSVDDLITLSGVLTGATHLGTFTGTTIPDGQTIKAALQALEAAFEALSIPTASSLSVDDLITLSGVLEGATNLGTFIGTTIPDSQTIKAAIQALETAFEALPGGHDAVTLTINDETPSVSGHSVFITANAATPTTISDFDDPTAGQIIFLIINDDSTTIDFTSSGIEGRDADYACTNGECLIFVYASQDSQWHYLGNWQKYSAYLADIANISPSTGDMMYFDGTDWKALTAGAEDYILKMGATIPGWSNALAIATLDLHAATSSIPFPYGTAAAPTTEGFCYWNTSTDTLTVGNGAAAEEMVTLDNTQTLTNKTLDANGTGNVLKGYGYITLRRPNNRGSATTAVTTTETDINYGMPAFADDVEANNYIDYFCEVPRDIDTSVDLVAWFKFRLGGADTADHDYIISMVSIADSAAQAGTPGNAINLSYAADASGASGDVETAGGDTLTDWKSNVTAGNLWMIRVTRDGDDGTNDASTVDSYPVELTIRYGWTQ